MKWSLLITSFVNNSIGNSMTSVTVGDYDEYETAESVKDQLDRASLPMQVRRIVEVIQIS
jgi:hypothetical protein